MSGWNDENIVIYESMRRNVSIRISCAAIVGGKRKKERKKGKGHN